MAVGDKTLTTYANFLYELQGSLQEVFPSEAPLLAELSGFDAHMGIVDRASAVKRISSNMEGGRDIISGSSIRHTILLSGLGIASGVSETGTWQAPVALQTAKANITLTRMLAPVSVSVDVERDSRNGSTSAASIVTELLDQASKDLARKENLAFHGDGTGKVQAIVSGSSPGLTMTVSTTGTANLDVLLPGSIWDILTDSTGAATTGGKRRKIASVSDSATTQTVTFDTAQAASDGDSGNITFSSSEGIYFLNCNGQGVPATIAGSFIPQGLEQIAAVTGTFEGIAKGSTQQWQGTDGRAGDTSTAALSAVMMDGAVRRGRRAAIGSWDFGIGDPAVIDLYKQGLYASVRYEPSVTTLKSGFSGIAYDGADRPFPLIKDPMHKKGGIKLVDKASLQLYGDEEGPVFLDDDGATWRRFSRSLVKEAEMLDRVQLGAKRCNTLVFLNNLQPAT